MSPESRLQSSHRDRPLFAIGLVLASTVFLSCSDVTAKYLASSVPAIEIAWLRYFVFLLIVLPPLLCATSRGGATARQAAKSALRSVGSSTSGRLILSSHGVPRTRARARIRPAPP